MDGCLFLENMATFACMGSGTCLAASWHHKESSTWLREQYVCFGISQGHVCMLKRVYASYTKCSLVCPVLSRGSSVSIASDYGLDDQGSIPDGGKNYFPSSLCVQTGSGGPPSLLSNGYWGTFPGGKARPGRDAGHSPPSSAEVVNEYELHILCPCASTGVLWDWFTFTNFNLSSNCCVCHNITSKFRTIVRFKGSVKYNYDLNKTAMHSHCLVM
jgi:hypothetical protein